MARSIEEEIARCDREIAQRKKDALTDDHTGGALLGLHDWFYERKLLIKEKNMPDQNAKEVTLAGGLVSSSEIPGFHLIPTEALVRLAKRFELGTERKKDKAWNALTKNQECLTDREFILHRISHVIAHALKLRDKITQNLPLEDDDAGAVIWGGAFLCCATAAKPPLNCSACGGTGMHELVGEDTECPACRGTGKSKLKG